MPDSTDEKLATLTYKRAMATENVVTFTRTLVLQLRDLSANHTADRLEAMLSEIDQLDANMTALIQSDPSGAVKAVLDRMTRR